MAAARGVGKSLLRGPGEGNFVRPFFCLDASSAFLYLPPMSSLTPEPEVMFTVREAAAMLRLFYKSVYRMKDRGDIKTVRIGSKVLIPASEIERLLRSKTDSPK